MHVSNEGLYMKRALELAEIGRGYVSPNPTVGCVIVHHGKIIGEGCHRHFGAAHAEVEAVRSVKDPHLLPESTLYVTLEPCAHHGKTPPCADFIIAAGIRNVIVGTIDPNPLTAGKGIERLRQAGVPVTVPYLEKDCLERNKRFFTNQQLQRPYIILKWAQTTDGFIADEKKQSKWISNELSRIIVHRMRAREDAVMVGTGTALVDNPRLNVRDVSGKNPLRVVIDLKNHLPDHLHLFDKTQPTVCYTRTRSFKEENLDYVQLTNNETLLSEILTDLYKRGVGSILVEGGNVLLNTFFQENLWDEAFLFTSPTVFHQGIPSPQLPSQSFRMAAEARILDDQLRHFIRC